MRGCLSLVLALPATSAFLHGPWRHAITPGRTGSGATMMMEAGDPAAEIAVLQAQLELTRMKMKLAELQLQAEEQAKVSQLASSPIDTVIKASETQSVPALTKAAEDASAQLSEVVAQTPFVEPQSTQASSAIVESTDMTSAASEVVTAAISSTGDLPVTTILAGVALLPIGAFAASKFADFINERYEEITNEAGSSAPSFELSQASVLPDMRSPVSPALNARPSHGSERSAVDIFAQGLANLAEEPTGWWFGAPSPLYSNLPASPKRKAADRLAEPPPLPGKGFRPSNVPRRKAAVAPQAPKPTTASIPMSAPASSSPRDAFLADVTGLPAPKPMPSPQTPPSKLPSPAMPKPDIQKPKPAPAPAMPAPISAEAAVADAMPVSTPAVSGRVVSTTSTMAARRRQRRANRAAAAGPTGAARVPPSTPEELELARRGEWSYGKEE
jgi:hypothetical protein